VLGEVAGQVCESFLVGTILDMLPLPFCRRLCLVEDRKQCRRRFDFAATFGRDRFHALAQLLRMFRRNAAHKAVIALLRSEPKSLVGSAGTDEEGVGFLHRVGTGAAVTKVEPFTVEGYGILSPKPLDDVQPLFRVAISIWRIVRRQKPHL